MWRHVLVIPSAEERERGEGASLPYLASSRPGRGHVSKEKVDHAWKMTLKFALSPPHTHTHNKIMNEKSNKQRNVLQGLRPQIGLVIHFQKWLFRLALLFALVTVSSLNYKYRCPMFPTPAPCSCFSLCHLCPQVEEWGRGAMALRFLFSDTTLAIGTDRQRDGGPRQKGILNEGLKEFRSPLRS